VLRQKWEQMRKLILVLRNSKIHKLIQGWVDGSRHANATGWFLPLKIGPHYLHDIAYQKRLASLMETLVLVCACACDDVARSEVGEHEKDTRWRKDATTLLHYPISAIPNGALILILYTIYQSKPDLPLASID
jgi:hypothetical protein